MYLLQIDGSCSSVYPFQSLQVMDSLEPFKYYQNGKEIPNLCILTTAMIFLIFAQIGISYAVLPYNAQASIISLFETNIQDFVPKSMQFNSVRIDQSPMLQDMINWLNENTSTRSKIIGSSDWRGWFVSGLAGNRGFIGYEEARETS